MKTKLLLSAKTIVCNLLLLSYFISTAQNEVTYQDEGAIMSEIKVASRNFLDNENILLNSLNAGAQLYKSNTTELNLPQPNTKELSAEEIFKQAKKSTLIIGTGWLCNTCDKTHAGTASGYIISEDGAFVTNYHVINSFIEAPFDKKVLTARTYDGKIYQVKKVLAKDKLNDLAILQLETLGDKLTPMPLGKPAAPGTKTYVLSNPKKLFYYFSQGMVARNSKMESEDEEGTIYSMAITADYAKGSSGGPVIDSYGNAIGTVSNTYSMYADQSHQANLQMVIKNTVPVIALKNIIEENKGS
ncbi:S1 family peptidase [Joostella sp. CR20]|uniref:S1 family peptidase n=1 Tax=Joostella sp. CR20 TaxID=2804312 RepID=UPI00313C2056